jgi:hypothetical protein
MIAKIDAIIKKPKAKTAGKKRGDQEDVSVVVCRAWEASTENLPTDSRHYERRGSSTTVPADVLGRVARYRGERGGSIRGQQAQDAASGHRDDAKVRPGMPPLPSVR